MKRQQREKLKQKEIRSMIYSAVINIEKDTVVEKATIYRAQFKIAYELLVQ